MANQWFRFHADALNNPKVQELSADHFKAWINILCVTSHCDGKETSRDDLAFYLRMSQEKTNEIIDHLIKKDLLIEGDGIIPTNWDERQYKSDTSAERTRKYRERKAKAKQEAEAKKKESSNNSDELSDGHSDVTVTPPDTDTDTDTNTDKKKKTKTKNKNVSAELQILINADVDEQLALDFLKVRKAKKAPFTKTALKGITDEADKAEIDLNRAITICINRNWQTFNSEWAWDTNNGQLSGTNSTGSISHAAHNANQPETRSQHHARISDFGEKLHAEAIARAIADGTLRQI